MAPSIPNQAQLEEFETDFDFLSGRDEVLLQGGVNEEEVVDIEDLAPDMVEIKNLLRTTRYVPTEAGSLRLGPRQSTVIEAEDVTKRTRLVEDQGHIRIRNLTTG